MFTGRYRPIMCSSTSIMSNTPMVMTNHAANVTIGLRTAQWAQATHARIQPVIREREILILRQFVIVLVVRAVPVEGRVGEDQVEG